MPESFNRCKRNGGRIRTVSGPSKHWGLAEGEYLHVCYLNGEAYRGEVHKKKEQGNDK